MALLGTKAVTLTDWAKRQDPNGKIARIIEMLMQVNEILDDIPFMEGNLPTGHRTTIRTGLPTVYFRLINQGVPTSKSLTAQVDEQTATLEAYAEVDVKLAELNGETGEFRASEAMSFIEAMNIKAAATIFYGNQSVSPEQFTGLAVRYSDLTAANAQNILDAGGTGSDNTSIFLVGWGEQCVTGIFPKGSSVGLKHTDKGQVTIENAGGVAGNRMEAFREHYTWDLGICVRDWRYCVRICNIDVSNLVAKTSAADLVELMIKATHRIPNKAACRPVFYVNRTVFEYLDIQRRDDVQVGGQLKYEEVDGKVIPTFRGIPVKICDALLETESRVV